MEPIDLETALASFTEHFSPRVLAALNGQHVKVAKLKGAFPWHAHADADELFFVLSGSFVLAFRDREVTVDTGQMIVVPAGVEHRPVAEHECAVLLFEPAGTLNTGDAPESELTTPGESL